MARKLKLQEIGGNLMLTIQSAIAASKSWNKGDEFIVVDNGKNSLIIEKVEP